MNTTARLATSYFFWNLLNAGSNDSAKKMENWQSCVIELCQRMPSLNLQVSERLQSLRLGAPEGQSQDIDARRGNGGKGGLYRLRQNCLVITPVSW